MAAELPADPVADLHDKLENWQQGDVATPGMMLSVANRYLPLTDSARTVAKEGKGDAVEVTDGADGYGNEAVDEEQNDHWMLVEDSHDEVVLISQTCDVVRHVTDEDGTVGRPWVQVAPLVEISDEELALARRTARWAPVPGKGPNAFADLDQCTTIEKSVLVQMTRTRGCRTDQELLEFAHACARHRSRFAFPNEMNHSVRRLRSRMIDKTGKDSPEGRCVDAVLEIRAEADGEWSSKGLNVHLHFIVDAERLPALGGEASASLDEAGIPAGAGEAKVAELIEEGGPDPAALAHARWQRLVQQWAARCEENEHISSVSASAQSEDEFPLSLYRRAPRLDLDFLSGPEDVPD